MGKRGPKPPPWEWYQKRYPLPLKELFDKLSKEFRDKHNSKEQDKLND